MNIAHAMASAKLRKFGSAHRNSCCNSVSAARSLILVSIGNLARSCVSLLPDNLRGGLGPPPSNRKELLASGRYGSGDLVERRVSDVKGFNLRRSLNYSGEELRHFWVSSAVVSLGILRFVPQTDSERFRPALANERDFVPESLLFSKQGEDVLLQLLGKLRNAIGLQMHVDSACKHGTLLGSRCQRGDSDNHLWFKYSEHFLSSLTMLGNSLDVSSRI